MSTTIVTQLRAQKQEYALNFEIKRKAEAFTERLFNTLFDEKLSLEQSLIELKANFCELLGLLNVFNQEEITTLWNNYITQLPQLLKLLHQDALAIVTNDPAAKHIEEVILCYPGFYAIAIYRLSHPLYQSKIPVIPRLMSEYAHAKTGTDIHPGAIIGASFFIDHATGIVIGETTVIADRVKLYQGVTLGALCVAKELANTKRHPTIANDVTIYANATILGGDTHIGAHSIIGGNVWLTKSIPERSLVTNTPNIQIKEKYLQYVNS